MNMMLSYMEEIKNLSIYLPYLFLSKGDNFQYFTNLLNSKLISELVLSDLAVFLCFYATQLRPILISITILSCACAIANFSK